MKKKDIEIDVLKIIEKRINKKIKEKDLKLDLYKSSIVDSFDILTITDELERKFDIQIDLVNTKNLMFSVSFLCNYIKKKI